MNLTQTQDTEAALRGLCAQPSSQFGAQLLERASGPLITFREFVLTARDMVRNEPEATATWLAALIALEMRGEPQPAREQPSAN